MLPKKLRFLHPYLHLIGLVLMIAGLPFSKWLMSLSQFFIGFNWILEGNYKQKLIRLRSNKKAWMLIGLYLMLIPGMLYTEHIDSGLKLLRINLPLFIFPFVLASIEPLKKSWYEALLKLIPVSVVLATFACTIWGLPHWLNAEFSDIRKISIFISHIRFALLISLSILLCFWMLIYTPFRLHTWEKIIACLFISWLTLFLFILQSLTGIAILLLIGLAWLVRLMVRRMTKFQVAFVSIILLGLAIGTLVSARRAYVDFFTPNTFYTHPPPGKTLAGNLYKHDFSVIENGHYVFAYVCDEELSVAWKERSEKNLYSSDGKGQQIYSTLLRFLNSKGLTKDSVGMAALSDKEIHFIEKGIANVNYTGLWGIRMRFYQLLWEFGYLKRGSNTGAGHTLVMKLEFIKNALYLIRENWLLGVGTGDVPAVFQEHYESIDSWLSPKWRMTCHNQYLYMGVAAGIPGMILFIVLFFWPLRKENYLPLTLFVIIAAISMLPEDTLTTQEGVSFVAFFYTFFLFARPRISTSKSLSESPSEESSALTD